MPSRNRANSSDISEVDDLDELLRRQEGSALKRRRISREDEEEEFVRGSSTDSATESGVDEDNNVKEEAWAGLDDDEAGPEIETGEEDTLGDKNNMERTEPSSVSSRLRLPSRKTDEDRRILKPQAPSKPSVTFSSLGVSRILDSALAKMSIRTPTEVQAACIPPLLEGAR